jgi:3-methylfumaryl-CoA hydratase
MSEWGDWVGREEQREDRLDPGLARRWCATFDLPAPAGAMPQGIHFCLCPPESATADLGEDGHPRRSDDARGLLPPIPQPRRMWAGSRIVFHRAVAVGDAVARTSRIASVSEKTGASGALVFVEIDHVTFVGGAPAVEERQTLVYRAAAAADAPLQPPPAGEGRFDAASWQAHRELVPGETLLFRYSALTFNSHRIHYDLAYARDIERYRGLVVHGPLSASLLLQLAAKRYGDNRLARFAFRGVSPAIAGDTLHLVMREAGDLIELGAFAGDGRQIVSAEAALA